MRIKILLLLAGLAVLMAGCGKKKEPEIVISERGVELRGGLPCVQPEEAGFFTRPNNLRSVYVLEVGKADPRLVTKPNPYVDSAAGQKAFYRFPSGGLTIRLDDERGIDAVGVNRYAQAYEGVPGTDFDGTPKTIFRPRAGGVPIKIEISDREDGGWREFDPGNVLGQRILPRDLRGRKTLYLRFSEGEPWPELSSLTVLYATPYTRVGGVTFCDEQ